MDDKKRDLIPVAAIALFLVIIIALCAVRLHQRRETRADRRNGKHADMVQRGTGRVCRIRDKGRSGSDGRNDRREKADGGKGTAGG